MKLYEKLGLKTASNDEVDSILYFNDSLLGNNIVIEEENLMSERNNVDTMISVHHVNKVGDITLDAATYTLYWDTLLSPIQVYGIIKEVMNLYNSCSPSEFIEHMYDLSISCYSSSMQSKMENSNDIMNNIQNIIDVAIRLNKEEEELL